MIPEYAFGLQTMRSTSAGTTGNQSEAMRPVFGLTVNPTLDTLQCCILSLCSLGLRQGSRLASRSHSCQNNSQLWSLGSAGMAETGQTETGQTQIGLLMLESRFPRFRGDIGHPATFNPPALLRTIKHATPKRVVEDRATGLVASFANAAKELEHAGAKHITTSCGFLVLHQEALQAAVNVPLISSALLAVPTASAQLRPHGLHPAILTISADNLTEAHLRAAGCPADTPIGAPGPDSHFCSRILANCETMDQEAARQDVISATTNLLHNHPNIGALVLECTNMPPYASDLAQLFKIPILSLPSLLPHCQTGLSFEAATRKALAA